MIDTEMNYFTVIEEHFQVARGSGSFRLSPVDWALIETWKESGVPLVAILRGIDRTFKNWHKQPARARTQRVNSVGYCTQEIAIEAQAHANAVPSSRRSTETPFSLDTVRQFVARNAGTLRDNGHFDLAAVLEQLDVEVMFPDFEQIDKRLRTVEETMIARLFAAATADVLAAARAALARDLKAYRERMTAEQLAMLEKQFLERRLLESAGLPRLSLFYL